jgi:hypothetical protein
LKSKITLKFEENKNLVDVDILLKNIKIFNFTISAAYKFGEIKNTL